MEKSLYPPPPSFLLNGTVGMAVITTRQPQDLLLDGTRGRAVITAPQPQELLGTARIAAIATPIIRKGFHRQSDWTADHRQRRVLSARNSGRDICNLSWRWCHPNRICPRKAVCVDTATWHSMNLGRDWGSFEDVCLRQMAMMREVKRCMMSIEIAGFFLKVWIRFKGG